MTTEYPPPPGIAISWDDDAQSWRIDVTVRMGADVIVTVKGMACPICGAPLSVAQDKEFCSNAGAHYRG